MKSLQWIVVAIAGIAVGVVGFSIQSRYIQAVANQGAATLPIAGQTYYLAGSGVSSSATSLTLTALTLPQNGYKIQDSDLSSTFYVTLEPGNRTKQEIVSCTTVVQNANGTATLSGCSRGLSPVTPYTASSTLQFAHGGSTQVVFSNPPQLYNEFAAVGNTATVTAAWLYSSTTPPRYDLVPLPHALGNAVATSAEFASIAYVDNKAVAGASNATVSVKGLVELAVSQEMSNSTQQGNTGAWLVLTASSSTSTPGTLCGFCVVVTNSAGKIARDFIGSSLHYIVGSIFATDATTTNATSTNFAVTTGNIHINGFNYRWTGNPGSASSSVLMTDGGNPANLSFNSIYHLILSTTTSQAMTFATTTLDTSTDLHVVIQSPNTAANASEWYMQLNNARSAYSFICTQVNANGTQLKNSGTNGDLLALTGNGGAVSTTSPAYIVADIKNVAANVKVVQSSFTEYGSATIPPTTGTCGGMWNNTSAQITTLTLHRAGPTIPAGTIINIYGR